MTPKKLRLQNFLSYPDEKQELDFDLFHLACLTGENGAGKSSLIEAIPWCVWGEGRVSDDRLLREGESEMRVEFEFALDDALYKIIRIAKRKKGGKVSTDTLEFQTLDHTTNNFRVVQSGARDAQKRINKTLGVDYDTFISSSFIVQGKSNEFTFKSASERKKILAEILQINRYQTLSERAKENAKKLKEKLERDSARLELLEEEVKQLPSVESDIDAMSSKIQTMELSEASLKAKLIELDATLKQAAIQKAELDGAKRELDTLLNQQRQHDAQLSAKERERKQLDALLLKQAEIEARKIEYDQTKLALSELDEKSINAQALMQTKQQLESTIREKTSAHEQKLAFEKNALRRLSQDIAAQGDLAQKKTKLQHEQASLEKEKVLLETKANRVTELQADCSAAEIKAATFKSEATMCNEKMEKAKEKGFKFKELKDAVCPLCQSPLTDEHRTQVLDELRKEYRDYQARQEAADAALAEIDTTLRTLRGNLRDAEKHRTDLGQCEKNLAKVVQNLESITEQERNRAKLLDEKNARENAVKTLESALQEGEFIESETIALEKNRVEIKALGYDATAHRALQVRAKELSSAERDFADVENAVQNAARLDAELKTLSDFVKAQREAISQSEARIASLNQALADVQKLETNRRNMLSELNALATTLRDDGGKLKSLQSRLVELEKKQGETETLKSRTKADRDDEDIYRKLADAFGIDGIQSMLIENAVPELEQAANEILSKLTSNASALKIETQKEQKNQKVVEALEIKISDERGDNRPYETFSGGEKFRIDFALRIALSKLLAGQRNAGVKFLVIDEGFGTQDAGGIETMIECVNGVSSEFEKIILITHLEKLRESFETKIFVSKEACRGSRFTVSSATVTD